MQKIFLVVGLGNPEKKYDKTYHNLGFAFADALAKKLGEKFSKEKGHALVCETYVGEHKVVIAKPKTYMNLSGRSVVALANLFKIDYKNIIIAFDDIDIELGKFRFKEEGSGGSHNGMKNIVELTGTKDIARIRIGVEKPLHPIDLADYILSKIPSDKEQIYKKAIDDAVDFVINYIGTKA